MQLAVWDTSCLAGHLPMATQKTQTSVTSAEPASQQAMASLAARCLPCQTYLRHLTIHGTSSLWYVSSVSTCIPPKTPKIQLVGAMQLI